MGLSRNKVAVPEGAAGTPPFWSGDEVVRPFGDVGPSGTLSLPLAASPCMRNAIGPQGVGSPAGREGRPRAFGRLSFIDMLIQAEKLRVEQKSKSLMYIDPPLLLVALSLPGCGSVQDQRRNDRKYRKGTWWMPGLSEATKDVTSCDKPRRGANGR